MKRIITYAALLTVVLASGCSKDNEPAAGSTGLTADHNNIDISQISSATIDKVKSSLHIAYGHTSHGSQITDGMTGLVNFLGTEYAWNNGGTDGALDLHDYAMSGDLGNPDFTQWEVETRNYLASHTDVNVIIWSWCGELSYASEENVNTYLSLMSQLEAEFPAVTFVYMTGHLDGTGVSGNVNTRNEQIRNYCKSRNKFLFDFADIESYDPDGNYYLDKNANDGCYYDSDNNGSLDANWAINWQNSHTEGVDWYICGSAHSQPLNANMKAYAAWYLWASIVSSKY
ncbi:MAG TPA: hypothetical protein VJ963_08695 [Bacteroidales bacterium]|nr:hypothetical protein [Bacteroidales bacterium]